jgi:hypothetical protein
MKDNSPSDAAILALIELAAADDPTLKKSIDIYADNCRNQKGNQTLGSIKLRKHKLILKHLILARLRPRFLNVAWKMTPIWQWRWLL